MAGVWACYGTTIVSPGLSTMFWFKPFSVGDVVVVEGERPLTAVLDPQIVMFFLFRVLVAAPRRARSTA